MVGRVMLQVLSERKIPFDQLIVAASEKSAGTLMSSPLGVHGVVSIRQALALRPDIALFSAGGSASLEWAPKFAESGCFVVDNSSAWRMDSTCPLVVPEINADRLKPDKRIIANPNCSTIQLVMVLHPLHREYGLKRVVVSTYQSVSGTGRKAVQQLENERANVSGEMAYPYPIDKNCLPHCDVFLENGYTKEEMKLVNESRKILDLPNLALTATAVRVPVQGGHSESVNIELSKPANPSDIRRLLSETPGVKVVDNPDVNQYPMPKYAEGKDEVFVGRIRSDESIANALNMWIVADNLRKGAATNAVQIAETIIRKGFIANATAK